MLSALIPNEPTTVDVLEKTTPKYTAVVRDNAGAAIPAASLTTLTLLLYVIKADGTYSYLRGSAGTGQNVLNTNNVTADANGNITWSIKVADTTLVEDVPFERHIALWGWTTATANSTGSTRSSDRSCRTSRGTRSHRTRCPA